MSEDYLWDKSGEPDPQVERLERLLGQLRHQQPAPDWPEARPHRFSPILALAAAVALVALAVAVWMSWQHQKKESTRPQVVKEGPQTQQNKEESAESPVKEKVIEPEPGVNQPGGLAIDRKRPRIHHSSGQRRQLRSGPSLTPEEEMAKERLMLALHIASAKLNLAQKKVQESSHQRPQS